ncbi:MAG: phosphomannomutase/phosphoglucomutase [Candidatus Fermentibacteraceae bacterium]|nr:phosphomannomutase/phosphoglucomutase [Candidatus Fermentibacteraceae bacterium]
MMNSSVFRKYDIRGLFPSDLSRDLTFKLGVALGRMAGNSAAVGRDCRDSGSSLMEWLSSGIGSTGCRVIDLGVQTTPMTYFAAHTLRPGVTVMITGSHNPPEYNGFKIMEGLETLHGESIQDLRKTVEMMEDIDSPLEGATVTSAVVRDAYVQRLMGEFSLDRSLKVVVDAGNGTGGDPAVEILEKLGCRVVPLHCRMDGSFPNHHPDPTVEKNLEELKRTVVAERADIGLAFDGDADRLGVIDDRGDTVWGDRVLIVLARALLKDYPGATVISEVKASRLFFQEVEKAGGVPFMSPTGHSLIKRAMMDRNALLAGEMSGHIFFRDRYYGYDDALYSSLRLLEILASGDRPLHSYLADLPEVCSTPEIREDCDDESKFAIVSKAVELLQADGYSVNTIDGARIDFPDGWGLVRASNTQPVLVLRFEAGTLTELADYEKETRKYIEQARRKLDV